MFRKEASIRGGAPSSSSTVTSSGASRSSVNNASKSSSGGFGIATSIATGILVVSRSRRKQLRKDLGAFIKFLELHPPPQPAPPIAPHPLTGLTFAIKDIFDVEGFVTGFGLPEWEMTHEPAPHTAHAVATLVQAGATCIGKTQMDEMGCGISGHNDHYEDLVNPVSSDYAPGGSSGGSAVAVSTELVDFALGTDTGGDVRVPAAFCEVLGFRPSHGSVSCSGVVPVSQSLDTVGWFARDAKVLYKVGQVLLRPPLSEVKQPRRILIADDCFRLLSVSESRHLSVALNAIENAFGKQAITHVKLGEYFASKISGLKMSLVCFRVDGEKGKAERGFAALKSLSDACQLLQGHEFKLNHEDWIHNSTALSASGRVKSALETNSELVSESLKLRNETRSSMSELLMSDSLLLIPTVVGPPPMLRTKPSVWVDFEEKALTLLSVASMSGCCQVSIPVGSINGYPSAISLVGKHGADHFLLNAADLLFPVLQKEAEIYTSTDHEDDRATPMPEAAEAAKEKGNEAFRKKDFKTAILSYSEAIECDEGNATYYSNRAAAYLALGNFHLAETDCSQAIDLDKKNVKAYMRRATARESLGCLKDADQDFKQALVLEPTNKIAADGVRRLKKQLFG
ncbi:hypothetical protein GOP47_0008032 [Adiantum capillus-veneris]|uniref:Amidase domain-containing protein n=1 Tax=Adiantum capillus-veneris TaxID=13818 RepID=A0A9D4ZJA2_ADICA|nr:hypothetical protein GOP47_0008032 [Adiantum capillus-veneris]